MKMFSPASIMDLVAWIASPHDKFESHGGLVNHWELDSQLFRQSKLDSKFEPVQSLVIPLRSNESPNDAIENINLNAHCEEPTEPFDLYQHNLQTARRSERIDEIKGYVQWLPRILRNLLDRAVFQHYQPVLQNGQQAGLTEQETVAIWGWTSMDYIFFNPIAWGAPEVTVPPFWSQHEPNVASTCSVYRADVWPAIEFLVGALNKLPPVQPNVTLFRGSRQSAEELGPVITGGFSSTSHSFDVALRFAGRTLWAIESCTSGKDITKFSAFPDEEEVLLPMGTRLEVVECSPTTFDDAMQQQILEQNAERWNYCIREAPPEGCEGGSNVTVLCMKEAPAQSETVLV